MQLDFWGYNKGQAAVISLASLPVVCEKLSSHLKTFSGHCLQEKHNSEQEQVFSNQPSQKAFAAGDFAAYMHLFAAYMCLFAT